MMLYATPEYAELARAVIRRVSGAVAGRFTYGRFKDGEPFFAVRDLPRNGAILLGATGPGEGRLVGTLLALDALKCNHAKQVTLVLPYAGFARQDAVVSGAGSPARLSGKLLRTTGARRIIVLDPHSTAFARSVPNIDAVSGVPVFAVALRQYTKDAVVAAPDHGARLRAMQLAGILGGLPTAYVDKQRSAADKVVARGMRGAKVAGKTVILIDDIIDTAGTMIAAARLMKQQGAVRVIAAATHGIFTDNAVRELSQVCDAIVVTNSLPQKVQKQVQVLDCAPLLAQAVRKHA